MEMAQNIVHTLIFAQHPAVSVYMDDPQVPPAATTPDSLWILDLSERHANQ